MTNWTAVLDRDALGQARLLRSGEISGLELVEAAIGRIEDLNPRLNAVITPLYDRAREEASGPLGDGSFAGVPFLLKDLLAQYAETQFAQGSRFLEGYVSSQDTELVKRYRRTGLIVIGKTNTPELGLGITTEPELFGPTHNPWDLGRTSGGSSGGSAAAVASGTVAMAHGNDAGGSIRIPASCCGVFGLKPSRARNPLGPAFGDVIGGLVAEHVLTRSVRDSAAMLDATAGPDVGDPYAVPAPERPFLEAAQRDPKVLRVAFSSQPPLDSPVHPDCVTALQEAASLCRELGHDVEEDRPQLDGELLFQSFTQVISAGFAWCLDDLSRSLNRELREELFEPFVWSLTQRGRQVSGPEYLMAWQNLQQLAREVGRFLNRYDVWMTPTLGKPPVPLGTFRFEGEDPFQLRRRMSEFTPFTYLANSTGQPAMSVPLCWNAQSLPIGIHFLGRFGEEETLFGLAGQLERARPWSQRRPSLGEE